MSLNHIKRRVLIDAQFSAGARNPPQIVSALLIALTIERLHLQLSEHPLARLPLIVDDAVLVVVEKVGPFQKRERDRHGKLLTRCDVAEDEAVRGVRLVTVRLLDTELDQELKEVAALERARQMGAVMRAETVGEQHEHHQKHVFVVHFD